MVTSELRTATRSLLCLMTFLVHMRFPWLTLASSKWPKNLSIGPLSLHLPQVNLTELRVINSRRLSAFIADLLLTSRLNFFNELVRDDSKVWSN